MKQAEKNELNGLIAQHLGEANVGLAEEIADIVNAMSEEESYITGYMTDGEGGIFPAEAEQWLDKPIELGIYLVRGGFQRGYTAVNIFIPDGLIGAGLSVEMIGQHGWYKLEIFIERFKATKWQKVEVKG